MVSQYFTNRREQIERRNKLDNLAYMVDVSISQAKAHVTLDQGASIVASSS